MREAVSNANKGEGSKILIIERTSLMDGTLIAGRVDTARAARSAARATGGGSGGGGANSSTSSKGIRSDGDRASECAAALIL